MAFGARGVAKIDGYTVFVDRALPGQRVEALVYRRKKRFAEARIEQVLSPSPHQVDPRCRHFGVCGGCALQHLDYEVQLEAKQDHVRDCLTRIGGLEAEVLPVVPAPSPYEYRGKMEYSFGERSWLTDEEIRSGKPAERFALGLHIQGRHDRVLNIHQCHLQPPAGSAILGTVRDLARQSGLPSYTTRTHEGFWRFLVVKEATTGERMVNIITNRLPAGHPGLAVIDQVAARLSREYEITSLLHSQTDSKANVARSEEIRVLEGKGSIRERILDCDFEIGPNTFFQSNPWQAERLFREALGTGDAVAGRVVWDLYCGVGALTLPLARYASRVVGMELVEASIEAARRNAGQNGIENVEFHAGDLKDLLNPEMDHPFPPPDVVVVDPPRDGMHGSVVRALLKTRAPEIVYVSCNPATLARDLALLAEGGYAVGPVQPVDMFPHTPHIECVTKLRKPVP